MTAGVLLASGCNQEEKQAIRETTRLVDELTDAAKGEEAVALFAPEAIEHFGRLVRFALDAPAVQVQSLPVSDQMHVLMMRNRMTRKELSPLDGRGWLIHAINKEWWFDPESWEARDIRLRGNSAQATAYLDGEETEMVLDFVKVDDRWTIDYRRHDPQIDLLSSDMAADLGITVSELLVMWEEEAYGQPAKPDIWSPMKK